MIATLNNDGRFRIRKWCCGWRLNAGGEWMRAGEDQRRGMDADRGGAEILKQIP
jgi:hypothetical protein